MYYGIVIIKPCNLTEYLQIYYSHLLQCHVVLLNNAVCGTSMQESFSMVLIIVNLRPLAIAVAQDNKTCQYTCYYNAGYCSYPPHCSRLVRKTVAGGICLWNSSNMVGLLFSWGDQMFQGGNGPPRPIFRKFWSPRPIFSPDCVIQ